MTEHTPRSGDEIKRIAREAIRASEPGPGDWRGFADYLRGLDLGPDRIRVLEWARHNVRRDQRLPELRHTRSWPQMAAASETQRTSAERCRYCGSPASATDHVWPRYRGGDDHPNNLVPVCTTCNTRKGTSSWLTDRCAGCGNDRDPGDVETATGEAFYACRCGASWRRVWDLQHIAPPQAVAA